MTEAAQCSATFYHNFVLSRTPFSCGPALSGTSSSQIHQMPATGQDPTDASQPFIGIDLRVETPGIEVGEMAGGDSCHVLALGWAMTFTPKVLLDSPWWLPVMIAMPF